MIYKGFFVNCEHQKANIDLFIRIMNEFSHLDFFHPNANKAPWHVQTVVGGVTVNFWPHTNKYQLEGDKAKTGLENVRNELRVLEAEGGFDVLE